MSENKLVNHPVKPEPRSSNPLDTLVAKKDLDGGVGQETFDLASASILNSDVLRATPRKVERRSVIGGASLTSKQTEREKRPPTYTHQKHGLIKNPLFKYEGGLINKLLSFFANLLKVIEQFALGALGNRAQSVFFLPSIKQSPEATANEERSEDDEREQGRKKTRHKTPLTIKRS